LDRTNGIGLADVLMQLKLTNRLLAAQLRGRMSQQELVMLLASTGASHQDIAEVLGTTAPTVSNALVRTRKRGKVASPRPRARTPQRDKGQE